MKNFILGFLTASVIAAIAIGTFFAPIYQKYKRYEAAEVRVVEETKNTINKIKNWNTARKDKNNK